MQAPTEFKVSMGWIIKCFRHYGHFGGRAGVRECIVFNGFALGCVLAGLGLDLSMGWAMDNVVDWMPWYPTFELTRLALIVPWLAVNSRRLHDTGESGWLGLLLLIPILGWFVLVPFLVKPGDRGENAYGLPEPDVPMKVPPA